mgnify:CR=1 FL=1
MESSEDLAPLLAEAQAHCDKGWWREARVALGTLYEKGHRPAFTAQQIGDVEAALSHYDDAIRWHQQAITIEPRSYRSHEILIFLQDARATTTEAQASAARRLWWDHCGTIAYAHRQPHQNTPHPYKRLRIGYVTGDVNFHSAAIAWTAVVARHTDQIETCLYSTLERHRYDNRTRLWQEALGNHFVDVSEQVPHQLALTIQQDRVDILVDLAGFTNNNRLMTFAYRPAPIQIQAWGYVLGTQSPTFDVLFADPIVAPPAIRAGLAERVIDLPCVLSYHPPSKATGKAEDMPGPTPLPCLTDGPTFCVFQRAMKITEQCVRVWRRILEALPSARILFKSGDYTPIARTTIADWFGPTRNQIVFDFNTSHTDHLLWYQDADLALDPWPQTGGVSTLEACMMHVPPVTLLGARMIQRTSGSIMTTVGFPSCVTTTEEEYIARAIALVTTHRDELAAMRATARTRLVSSPICIGYVEAVEQRYRMLWQEWCDRQQQTSQQVM